MEKDSEEVQPISATSSGNHFKRFHGAECPQADEMRPFMHHLLHLTGKNCQVFKNTPTSSPLLNNFSATSFGTPANAFRVISQVKILFPIHTLGLKPLWAGSAPIASWRQRCFKCILRERKYKPHLCWFLIKKKNLKPHWFSGKHRVGSCLKW